MASYDKNHYIQKALLNRFAIQTSKNHYKICVLDLINFNAAYLDTSSAFQENKLYDVPSSEDIKELEHKFSIKIEQPMSKIVAKCVSENNYAFKRYELETIKKYILLQLYRTPNNRRSYVNVPQNAFELSQFNINEGESREDFWKREMLCILDNSFDSLLTSDMVGIKKHAMEINTSFLMFLHTDNELCINDLGYATERIPVKIPKSEQDSYIRQAKEIGKILFGKDNFDEIAKREIANHKSYFDNYILFPISSNIAILSVSPVWKYYYVDKRIRDYYRNTLFSPLLMKHFSLPKNTYVNKDKIKTDTDIPLYKDENDLFEYEIQQISSEETIYLNHLLMNEALRYIGIKTPSALIPSIREYNRLESIGTTNLHHNYKGFVELLTNLKLN